MLGLLLGVDEKKVESILDMVRGYQPSESTNSVPIGSPTNWTWQSQVPLDHIPNTLTGKDADTVDGKHASELGKILDRDASGNIRYEDTPSLINNNDISGSCSAVCDNYCDAYSDTFVKTPDTKFVKCHCEFYPTTDGARCRFKLSDGTNTIYTGYSYDSASVWVGCTQTIEISQLQNTTITVTVQLCGGGGDRQARYLYVYKNKLTSLI